MLLQNEGSGDCSGNSGMTRAYRKEDGEDRVNGVEIGEGVQKRSKMGQTKGQ